MTSIISSWEVHSSRYLTCGTGCCGAGVLVWTKPAAAKREGYVGCTGRGCASISKQDFSDNLVVALLVREAGLISPGST
jgi:hypothetical protein